MTKNIKQNAPRIEQMSLLKSLKAEKCKHCQTYKRLCDVNRELYSSKRCL